MAFFGIFNNETMSISEAYRKRLPILTRTIFEDVMNASKPNTSLVDIPTEFVKENLNQKIWNGTELRPEVYKKILEIVQVYKDHLNLPVEPKAVRFLGSMANYNWTEFSDIDIHLFYDLSKISENAAFAKEYLDTKGIEWKNTHHVTFRGYPAEMYAQDIKDIFYSGGVYDILKNKWVNKPSRDKVIVDKNLLRQKITSVIAEIRTLHKLAKKDVSAVYSKAKRIKDKIKRMRQSGLESEGEYSIENLTFKYLRNKGLLEKLSDIILKAFDSQLSLDEKKVAINESIQTISDRIGIDIRHLKQTIFKGKRNPNLVITVTMTKDGKIVNIENPQRLQFPFVVGQTLNRNHETWACNNNYTVNNKDTCPEEKIFGIRKKDIPPGHEFRMLFPNKFKNESKMTLSSTILAAAKKAKINLDKYDPSELNAGFKVEKEHGKINPKTNVTDDDEVKTLKIALAHLNEVPDYYTKLAKYVEKENISESDIIWTPYTNKSLLKENNSEPKNTKHRLVLKKSIDNFDENKLALTKEFIIDCCAELGITEPCQVFFTGTRGGPITTTASYNPGNDHIWIYAKNRNMLADPLRSLAHEIRHFKQKLDGVLHEKSGEDGSEHENEANSFSGLMIRKFGKKHRDIYN